MREGRAKEFIKGTNRRRRGGRFPIDKFLFSRVGEQWDDVYSELSKEFKRRTFIGHTFWRTFEGYYHSDVAINCWIGAETGTIYDGSSGGWRREGDTPVEGFYVHPWTGILCYKKRPVSEKRSTEEVTEIKIDEFNAFKKIEGIWYKVKYKLNPYYVPIWYTPKSEKYILENRKYQLSSKQLHAMNLTNDHPLTWQMKVCEVCLYIDGNKRLQRCFFCKTCNAWICDSDKDKWYRRTEAATKKLLEKKRKEQEAEQSAFNSTAESSPD